MTQAAPTLYEFLKTSERRVTVKDAGIKATWGDDAGAVTGQSPLLSRDDAVGEATRQQGVTGQPLAEDQVSVTGLYSGMEGQTIYVKDARLGYGAGQSMLVTSVSLDFNQNRTTFGGYVRL